ncbi:MAG: biotin/lipoyl-binding protein, partial [SAR324 cluster bacterium]|nr:biotin/lipoyl-binding protein [SAR324 cluster bacterium]
MRNLLVKLFGALFIFLILLVASCGDSKSGDDGHSGAVAPVRVFKVQSKQETVTEKVPGNIRSKLRANIEAKVPGRIEKMLAVEGKTVKEGDLLAELDVKEIKAKLDQAIVVREQAERDLKRSKMLLERKAGSQADFENMNAKAQVSRAA